MSSYDTCWDVTCLSRAVARAHIRRAPPALWLVGAPLPRLARPQAAASAAADVAATGKPCSEATAPGEGIAAVAAAGTAWHMAGVWTWACHPV